MKFMQHMMAENAPVETATLSRRSFLKVTGGTAAGLVIGFSLPTVPSAEAANAAAQFNPFVRIAPDGVVTVIVKHLDMGQGTFSALATLVAEELDADWSQVQGDYAPADGKRYGNLFWGGTAGYRRLVGCCQQLHAVPSGRCGGKSRAGCRSGKKMERAGIRDHGPEWHIVASVRQEIRVWSARCSGG